MKKLTLAVCLLATTLASYSQAKFYSNGKQVTELKCDMPDIKVVIPIPDDVYNHDEVELSIDYLPADESYDAQFYFVKMYKKDFLKSQKEAIVWIKSPKMQPSDFCLNATSCFNIDEQCTEKYRNYTSAIISVRFYGKDITGNQWIRNQQVPTYKYSAPISKSEIKMNYGEIIKKISSKNNTFTGIKFFGPKYVSNVWHQKDSDDLVSEYSSIKAKTNRKVAYFEHPIHSHFTVIKNEVEPSAAITIDYVKHAFLLQLLKDANKHQYLEYKKDNLENPSISYYNYYMQPIVKNMQLQSIKKYSDSKAERKGEVGALDKLFKEQEGSFNWEKIKIGEIDAYVLKLKAYSINDMERGTNEPWSIKPASKIGFYYFYVGEKKRKSNCR